MITQILLYVLFLMIGVVAGIILSLWIANLRVERGTLLYSDAEGKWCGVKAALNSIAIQLLQATDVIYQDDAGEWRGSEQALADLTQELLYPDECLAEWEEEDDRPVE